MPISILGGEHCSEISIPIKKRVTTEANCEISFVIPDDDATCSSTAATYGSSDANGGKASVNGKGKGKNKL